MTGTITPHIKNKRNRYFFQADAEHCYPLDSHFEYMVEHGIKKMEVVLAQREVGSDFFYCNHFQEIGERGGWGECGKICPSYAPRNKKSGVCKHFGYTYSKTEQSFKLEIDLFVLPLG